MKSVAFVAGSSMAYRQPDVAGTLWRFWWIEGASNPNSISTEQPMKDALGKFSW